MTSSPIGHGQGWYLILPDTDASLVVATRVNTSGLRVICHLSGRPWLLGQWEPTEMVFATSSVCSLAIAGEASVSPARLEEMTRRLHDVGGATRLASEVAGSFHLVASVEGEVCAQGTISGLRRLFYAQCNGISVACSHSDVLATLTNAVPDEQIVAAHLMAPAVPYPLADQSVWRGIGAVPDDSYLLLDRDGRSHIERRWVPPKATLPLEEGARRLAESLTGAVAVRTQGGGVVSADLSGGMDSTSLCFCANRGPAALLTFTRISEDAANDDAAWAAQAAALLDGRDRIVARPSELPGFYAELLQAGEGMDEPVRSGRVRGEYRTIARWFRARGSRVHLSGEGGDQILQGRPSYLHTTFRSHPWSGIVHTRAHIARNRWRWASTLRALADTRTYGKWLADSAADLSPRPVFSRSADLGWQMRPQLPPWVTPTAVDSVQGLMRRAASGADPLAPERGQHSVLWGIREGARLDRHLSQITAGEGVPISFPFYDDNVIEAALAVRLHARTSPFSYKPLLTAAMRGIVPQELLGRRTKGEYSADVHAGFRSQRNELKELLDQPILAELGLVDADALRRACFGLFPPGLSLVTLETTLLLECWLRAHTMTSGAPDLAALRGYVEIS